MTSIGIGGLIVGNAGAEEPVQGYVKSEGSGVDLISPVSPVAPLEKKSTRPTQPIPDTWAPGSEAPEVVESEPAAPWSASESSDGSMSPVPARPTHVPSTPLPTDEPGSPSTSPSESPSESPTESESPSEEPSDTGSPSPTESPSEEPSDPSEPPSE
ncbi:hypothetical protein J2S40_002128 [Nocardioides luteus]|nr:hypothetical protein [Nocardioides luteus]MDR7311070.1 hypothetical protein [Nocardioides luteus]